MEPAVDPFHPLLRLVDRYRQGVHHLRPSAGGTEIEEAEQRLGLRLPPSLVRFLERWDGALLFRGVLRVRSTRELAPVREDLPRIILFADGPRDGERWAFVETREAHVFGRWDGHQLQPRYLSFHRWLMGHLHVLEEAPKSDEQKRDLLLSCDPRNPFLLLDKAEALVTQGDPAGAEALLRQATATDPDLLTAWQRLGDVLVHTDRAQARWAYVKALRAVRLPLPYPGARTGDADLVSSLEALFDRDDPAWERELEDLVSERVTDASTQAELDLLEAAGLSWARILLGRGDREAARRGLADLLERAESFARVGELPGLRLLLAGLETDLGHHDDAERRLRPLHESADPQVRGRARLVLGRLVVIRQEPWAEEVLEEARRLLTAPGERAQALLLLAERQILTNRPRAAAQALAEARTLLQRSGEADLLALAALLQGDLLRVEGDLEAAGRQWAEAEERAVAAGDRELRFRLALRAGERALARGDRDGAVAAWERARAGFQGLSLPIREAWALLRLGRAGVEEALRQARIRFTEADLAAGVAAVDAAAGDLAISLPWHRDRATEHARLRSEAQRTRPPLRRADADRPERRLGAHQSAIAACGKRVVEALEADVLETVRALEGATLRAADPRLARYTAAVDLLAHHRSYEAAQALLGQLGSHYVSGPPGRALKSALSRSPNAALVDGLLEILERGEDPVAVARAAEILGWRRERAAIPRLRHLVVTPDVPRNVRRTAVEALGRTSAHEAVEDILGVLDVPELAEAAAVALLLLGDRRGVDFHAQVLSRGDGTRGGSPGEIVGRYGDPSYLLLLRATVGRDEEMACGALHGLGLLGDLRAVETLIDAAGRAEPRVAAVASAALEVLTGHHEPPEVPDARLRWKKWWEHARPSFMPGLRYRYGKVLDAGVLIGLLGDDDLRVRRAAFDELVITTGVDLPFDADGAWRMQVHHREAWEAWWRGNREACPAGRWLFHGEIVG